MYNSRREFEKSEKPIRSFSESYKRSLSNKREKKMRDSSIGASRKRKRSQSEWYYLAP